jgi:hypothetical protein
MTVGDFRKRMRRKKKINFVDRAFLNMFNGRVSRRPDTEKVRAVDLSMFMFIAAILFLPLLIIELLTIYEMHTLHKEVNKIYKGKSSLKYDPFVHAIRDDLEEKGYKFHGVARPNPEESSHV